MGNSTGKYYTPKYLADFLTKWAVRSPNDSILDPAAGDGAILKEALKYCSNLTGVEIDKFGCKKLKMSIPKATVINSDFFLAAPKLGKFDAVISNPPYIRSHIFKNAKGSASSWLYFLMESVKLLKQGGRLAFLLPREILFANYSKGILENLHTSFKSITVLITNFFAFDAQTRVILLLCDNDSKLGILFKNINNPSDLNLESLKPLVTNDWLYDLIPSYCKNSVKHQIESTSFQPLASVADVRLGIVTGNNDYFLLSNEQITHWQLNKKNLQPAISSATHLKGSRFTKHDFNTMSRSGENCYLFTKNDGKSSNHYIRFGEKNLIHTHYKCRIRHPWYSIKTPKTPDGFLSYMIGSIPKLVKNDARVLNTNNLHSVYTRDDLIFTSFYNWITLISIEMLGRIYGGGVLKIEPRDSARIVIPKKRVPVQDIDKLLRSGQFIQAVDRVSEAIGLREINKLKRAWCSLQDARKPRVIKPASLVS